MRFSCLVVVLVGTVLLVGCGGNESAATAEKPTGAACPQRTPEKGPRREAWITLDGYHGPQNVGILMAAERGYFADAGIQMTITSPADPASPLDFVREEVVDFAVSHQPAVVMAKEEGTPVVAVGALMPRPAAAMIWPRRSKIRGIDDLKGKTIAIPGVPFQEDLLQSSLERSGLTLKDVEVVRAGNELAFALLSGRADAIFGGSRNLEGVELELRGLGPVVTPVRSLGVPAYDELVVVARSERPSREPQLICDLMWAVARGTAAAVEDPEGAIELIEESAETDPRGLSRKTIRAQVEATLPLLSKTGYMDPRQAAHLIDWMREQGSIEREPATSALFTNDYLPAPLRQP